MSNETKKSQIVLVDDHRLVRRQVAAMLSREPDLEICGEAADAAGALSLIREQRPDLVVLDIGLKRSNGLDLLAELKRWQPNLCVLVLSMHDEILYAERALWGGATGYITKEEATVHLLSAIRKVLDGQVYLSERIAARMAEKRANPPPSFPSPSP
jgi:DNA-binding NarL/FixJ family response regulator